MDQIKIGKFISECRKKNNLTQMQLAERLNITDRAISKWETGKSMPDSSLMLPLCRELNITVNDLLSGEVVMMDAYNEKLEKNLLETLKEKEVAHRRLLTMEIVLSLFGLALFFPPILVAAFVEMAVWMKVVLIIAGFVPFLIAMFFALRIEQVAGYYECGCCHHKYIPTFKSVFFAMHAGRTRYMKCPVCKKRSWHKKRISMD